MNKKKEKETAAVRRDRYGIFCAYVLPSVLSFALSGVYAIVDGFFVGNSIGDAGLSAINIAYPVTALIQAVGTGAGMGGAVLYAVRLAEKRKEQAESVLRGTLLFLAAASLVLTLLLLPATGPLLTLMGAEGQLHELGREYLRIIVLGSVFQVFGTGIVPLIRNNNGSLYAMFCMIAGFLTNIVLDYAFVWVFSWGMTGAAAATILGQGVTMAGGFLYLIGHKIPLFGPLRGAGRLCLDILRIGLAPFGNTMCPMISLLLMNKYSLSWGGEPGVACYACVAYIMTIVYLLLQGVGDGSQPLMSRYYGMGNREEVNKIRGLSYLAAWIIGGLCIAVIYWSRTGVGALFGASAEVSADVASSLPIFLAAVPFLSFTRVTTSALYATEQNVRSYILVYAEPVFLALLLPAAPRLWGLDGVWWSMALAQILTALAALAIKLRSDRD